MKVHQPAGFCDLHADYKHHLRQWKDNINIECDAVQSRKTDERRPRPRCMPKRTTNSCLSCFVLGARPKVLVPRATLFNNAK